MGLLEVHAAVDVDLGAGDVVALGHQEAAEARPLPRLGGGVVRLAQVAHLTDDGRHVDDAPAAALYHVRQRRVRAVEDAVQVRGDDLSPLFHAHAADPPVAVDAGGVDQDIDGPGPPAGRVGKVRD